MVTATHTEMADRGTGALVTHWCGGSHQLDFASDDAYACFRFFHAETMAEDAVVRDVAADWLGDLADIRMLAMLCRPGEPPHGSGMLTFGAVLIGTLQADPCFAFVRSALMASANGVPPKGTRDQNINRCSSDPLVRRSLLEFSIDVYAHGLGYLSRDLGDPSNFDLTSNPELLFWHCLRAPKLRTLLYNFQLSAINRIEKNLGLPINWLAEFAARGKSAEQLDNDPNETLLGFPMVAGVILLLIAGLGKRNEMLGGKQRRKEGNASLNYATEIVQAYALFGDTSTVARRLKGEDVWQRWRWFAPAWAGVLAEANGADIEWLRQPDLLTERIFGVVRSEERRVRAFGFARWFADYASGNEADHNATGKPHIPAEEVVWSTAWLRSEKPPPLPVLTPEIFNAVATEREASRKNAERMRKERAQREEEARGQ